MFKLEFIKKLIHIIMTCSNSTGWNPGVKLIVVSSYKIIEV